MSKIGLGLNTMIYNEYQSMRCAKEHLKFLSQQTQSLKETLFLSLLHKKLSH